MVRPLGSIKDSFKKSQTSIRRGLQTGSCVSIIRVMDVFRCIALCLYLVVCWEFLMFLRRPKFELLSFLLQQLCLLLKHYKISKRGHISIGRVFALQARGFQFKSGCLHKS